VGGVNLKDDLPYLIVAHAIGIVGLAAAYSNVARWVKKQRAIQNIPNTGEELWFSLFYNNAFYVFLLFLGSHLVFSTLSPATSLILTQLAAVLLPAWMSTLSK
jgi:predicted tellurium resistance membrane protein TerC